MARFGEVGSATDVSLSPSGLGFYGDGSDGDATISTAVQLGVDKHYNNLTITADGALKTGGYRVFVKGTLTNAGLLHDDGLSATSRTGGGGAPGGTVTASGYGAGGAGGTTAGGTAGTAAPAAALGGRGGSGGAGSAGAGAAAGALTAMANDSAFPRTAPWMVTGWTYTIGTGIVTWKGGSGGGGGGSTGASDGGGGGGGAGVMVLCAKTINNTGTISCNGGNGANGQATNAGGGGGGGGGAVLVVYQTMTAQGTITANGGHGGTATGTGVAGSDGSAGIVVLLAN